MKRLFHSPIGDFSSIKLWPDNWVDANPYGNRYELRKGRFAYHTGADLNLNVPQWDSDNNKPVYSIGSGVVTFAKVLRSWGNLIVIAHEDEHGNIICSRYAHMRKIYVNTGDTITPGYELGIIGGNQVGLANHLHFDISHTETLIKNPGHWPGLNRDALIENYIDPLLFLRLHSGAEEFE